MPNATSHDHESDLPQGPQGRHARRLWLLGVGTTLLLGTALALSGSLIPGSSAAPSPSVSAAVSASSPSSSSSASGLSASAASTGEDPAVSTGGRIAGGFTVGGVDLGGLKRAEALQKLSAARNVGGAPNITVRAGTRSWTLPAAQLGWSQDLAGSVDAALRLSLARTPLDRLRGFFGQADSQELPLLQTVDAAQARRALAALTRDLGSDPLNARIVFDKGRYAVRGGTPSRAADVAAASALFARQPDLRDLTVALLTRAPAVTAASLQPVVDRGNTLVRPLILTLGPATGSGQAGSGQAGSGQAGSGQAATPSVPTARTGVSPSVAAQTTLTPVQVANLFWVRPTGITLDRDALAATLKGAAYKMDRPAQNARYLAENGQLARLPERGGVVTDQAAALGLLQRAVLAPGVTALTLPARLSKPSITLATLPDPTKLSLIASGRSTYYHSSAQRRTNVAAAAARINGAVVGTGETFSFLDTLGGITADNGFVGGLIISGGRTVDGLGGGVCQVSTTTFRALYRAGLPVVERNQHSYRVGYYEPQVGFEAAVYDPGLDLKVQNDTGGPLLIRTSNDDASSTLTVQVWGLPQTRTVSVSRATILSETPHPAAKYVPTAALPRGVTKQVDWAADGFDLYITRTIRDGGDVRSDKTVTKYKPWQAVYEVGM